jgi:hypothetical protein
LLDIQTITDTLARILIFSVVMLSALPERPTAPNPFGELQSVKPCDHNLRKVILLAERMIKLSDDGDDDREDTGCGILYGLLRDSGYKIKQLAEAEKLNHIAKGWWDESC